MLITTGLTLTSALADHRCVLWLYRVRAITGLRSFGPNLIIANLTKIDPLLIRAITMAFLLEWARNSIRRAPSPPMRFPASGFEGVNDSEVLDEERFEGFKAGRYYPVNIGDIFASKYHVIGKLGFGVTSTVWLARNLQ
jgi:hypothetical protein